MAQRAKHIVLDLGYRSADAGASGVGDRETICAPRLYVRDAQCCDRIFRQLAGDRAQCADCQCFWRTSSRPMTSTKTNEFSSAPNAPIPKQQSWNSRAEPPRLDLECPLSANSGHCAYSMTSSAVASSDCGILRPSAFAVLRLMTISYLVGACTGKSAGFSPLRIRST